MVLLEELTTFLDKYLKINDIEDKCWNGLQVEGRSKVNKSLFAVDACVNTFQAAVKEKADIVIVHHGHFWKTLNPSQAGWQKDRIKLLLENDISLYACHLPLDRHREVGNNANLLKILKAKIIDEFYILNGKNVGWIGEFPAPAGLDDIEFSLNSGLYTECRTLPFGSNMNKTVAVCSGGGNYDTFFEALKKKVDLYITGDTVDIYSAASDAGINVIFAGHQATDRVGLKALSELLGNKFDIFPVFADNPSTL